MIESITLRNYRGHADTTLSCGSLTVLVGENAAGKTSVLRAVRWMTEGLKQNVPSSMLRRGADELEVVLDGRAGGERFHIDARYKLRKDADILDADSLRVENPEHGSIGLRPNAIFLSLDRDQLAAPSVPGSALPELAPSGRGLASMLAYLKLAETERFQNIVENLRAVVPLLRGIGFTRVAVSETVQRIIRVEDRPVGISDTVTTIQDTLLFDFADADKVPAELASEGTLVALGIFTAIERFRLEREPQISQGVMKRPVDVVLIDDIDRALHPRAQRKLIATLRAIVEATPNLQIIATSHSPYLLDALQPSEVVLLGRNSRGIIVAKRLDDFPDERLKKMLSTGELWMSEGDDWVAR